MIKVLHILTDSNIGGAGRCLINYLQYYNKSRFDVKVVLPKNSKLIPEVEQYIPVIAADNIAETSFSFASLKVLKQIIRAEAPDIVHTHGSLSGRVAAKQLGAKVVYTRHSAFPVPRYLKSGLGHRLYGLINAHYADRIIADQPRLSAKSVRQRCAWRKNRRDDEWRCSHSASIRSPAKRAAPNASTSRVLLCWWNFGPTGAIQRAHAFVGRSKITHGCGAGISLPNRRQWAGRRETTRKDPRTWVNQSRVYAGICRRCI